jgi:N-acetylneuraminic acid mutarotase
MDVDNDLLPELGRASHWETLSGYGQNGDYSHSAVWDTDNNQVLLFGGRHWQGNTMYLHSALWAYDPGSQDWTELRAALPLYNHKAVWAPAYRMMIVVGGYSLSNNQLVWMNSVLCYWPANNSWAVRGQMPSPLVFHSAAWDSTNNKMYVVGGTPDGNISNSTNDLWEYDPASDTWDTGLAKLPRNQARGAHVAVWNDDQKEMLVTGGIKSGGPMSSVFTYSPSSNTWSQMLNAPISVCFHSASWDSVKKRLYSYGGRVSGGGLPMTDRFYEYDAVADRWKDLEAGPDARWAAAFVRDPVHDLGLHFGGASTRAGNPNTFNDVMVYRRNTPYLEEGWLIGPVYDVQGILGVGELSWKPTAQAPAVGAGAVKFQVASSSTYEVPSEFVGPDGTDSTFYTNPEGSPVGDFHNEKRKIAYKMFFHTDDTSQTPEITEVTLEVFRYSTKGTYTSPIMDLGQPVSNIERVRYNSQVPDGVNPNLVKVDVFIRTSPDEDMNRATAWEKVKKDDTTIAIPYGQYLQFKVELFTDSSERHLTPIFKDITIDFNSPPVLTNGRIDRLEGDRTTFFIYTITYTDVDNNEPTKRNVVIDGTAFPMSSGDTDFTDGAVYRFQTPLALGEHVYYFQFSDGRNAVTDPPGGEYQGPSVLNRGPIPKIDYPATGTRVTPDEPVEFSATRSSDPDDDRLSFKWTSNISGVLDEHDSFITKLEEGMHLITLEVTDALGAVNTTSITILSKAYQPFLEITDVYISKDEPTERDSVTITAIVKNTGEARAVPAFVEFIVNDEVIEVREETLDIDDRMTLSFDWVAVEGRSYLGVRTRWDPDEPADSEMVKSVNVTANSPPEISVDISAVEVLKDQSVLFVNNGTSDADGDRLTFLWDFGDGTPPVEEPTTQHVYASPGTYYVNLTVKDTRGGSERETYVIVVKDKDKKDEPGFASTAAAVAMIAATGLLAVGRHRRRTQ